MNVSKRRGANEPTVKLKVPIIQNCIDTTYLRNVQELVEQARTVNPFEIQIALSDCTAPSFASTQGAVQTYREGFFSFDPTNWCIMVYAQR